MTLFLMDPVVKSNKLTRSVLYLIILVIYFFPFQTTAQSIPPLERVVTISFEKDKYDIVLQRLSKEGKFTFSYSTSLFDPNTTVTGTFTHKTIREILNQLFNGKIVIKEKGNYIILTKAAVPAEPGSSTVPMVVTGYVSDDETGEKIPEVSIYDKRTLSSVVSNQYGFFKLRIDKPSSVNHISVNKRGYMDTVISIHKEQEVFVEFLLTRERPVITVQEENKSIDDSVDIEQVVAEEIGSLASPEIKKEEPQKDHHINMLNIRDTLYRDFQVSLVPFIGTNEKLSGNVINDYSLNVLGGYSLGTQKVELGGLFNIDRGHVKGVQAAGLFNAVGGQMSGLQAAGVINMNNKEVKATQLAGTINFNLSGVEGVQVAGTININGGKSKGVQVAGMANIQVQDYQGSQISGLINVATHRISGTQVSGLVNCGRVVKGSQIGVVNIADSMRGVPVGVISLVRKGYHKIELSADEIFYTNLAFRTGVRQFYNIFTAGIKPDTFGDPVWSLGYGIGTAPRLTRWLFLNFDLTANHIEKGHLTLARSLLNKLYMGFDFQITKKLSVTMGATWNAYITSRNTDISEYPVLFTDFTPHITSDKDIGDSSRLQMWWGGKIGIRFL